MSASPACRNAALPLAVLLGSLLAGCSGDQVKLEVIDETGFAEVLAQHRGKVVLVDYWATWCGPCRELFPHTVELHKQYAGRGLVVISVSMDDPENRPAALRFLAANGATFQNFISPYNVGPQVFDAFEIDDGALPHFKLYDRQGKLHKSFASGGESIDPQQIDRAVKDLLRTAYE